MNTLVEKMFGIIMFLAIFVPFQLGLYTSYMDSWEFTQVTTEFTQLVKEEGGASGRVDKFKKQLKDESGYTINIKNLTGKTYTTEEQLAALIASAPEVKATDNPSVGDVLTISYKKNVNGVFGWGNGVADPKLEKVTNVTVYKR